MMIKWVGILICLIHSALFSGLNLGFFGLSRLKLEVQAETGNLDAKRILRLREDAHFLLATLLWGNVASNVMLALIAESVLSGFGSFIFSTFGITLLGEVFPQAYLSKHALKTSAVLVPIVRLYQVLLYPIAKPTALLLDHWLGKEKVGYFNEIEIMEMLQRHAQAKDADVGLLETKGAINFLALDDIRLEEEGEIINPKSIIALKTHKSGFPVFPEIKKNPDDTLLQKIHESDEKWVIITDLENNPKLVLNADQFLRDAVYEKKTAKIRQYCHRPLIVTKPGTTLEEVILKFKVFPEHAEDDVIDQDLIIFWGKEKRIITGADILGRLLRGIVKKYPIKPKIEEVED